MTKKTQNPFARRIFGWTILSLGLAFCIVDRGYAGETLAPTAFPHFLCAEVLSNTETEPLRLAIGVIAELQNGGIVIGMSPYSASAHMVIVEELIKKFASVTRVLWSGELKYHWQDGKLRISEANETSGYFKSAMKASPSSIPSIEVTGRSLPFENSVNAIPAVLKGKDFVGWHFHSASPQRLAPEIEGVDDVRHLIGNALQILTAVRTLVNPRASEETKLEILKLVQKRADVFNLARFLVLNLADDHRIERSEALLLIAFLDAFRMRHPLTDIQRLDSAGVLALLDKLSEIMNPKPPRHFPVYVYALD